MCKLQSESEINCVSGIISFFLYMYEHIFQHYVTFLQNGTSRAMTHHHSPGWWVMTHHSISRGWQVWNISQKFIQSIHFDCSNSTVAG